MVADWDDGGTGMQTLSIQRSPLDLCIERTEASGAPPSSLTTRELATKVVELSWNHVAPYGTHGTLRFGGGRDPEAHRGRSGSVGR